MEENLPPLLLKKQLPPRRRPGAVQEARLGRETGKPHPTCPCHCHPLIASDDSCAAASFAVTGAAGGAERVAAGCGSRLFTLAKRQQLLLAPLL